MLKHSSSCFSTLSLLLPIYPQELLFCVNSWGLWHTFRVMHILYIQPILLSQPEMGDPTPIFSGEACHCVCMNHSTVWSIPSKPGVLVCVCVCEWVQKDRKCPWKAKSCSSQQGWRALLSYQRMELWEILNEKQLTEWQSTHSSVISSLTASQPKQHRAHFHFCFTCHLPCKPITVNVTMYPFSATSPFNKPAPMFGPVRSS